MNRPALDMVTLAKRTLGNTTLQNDLLRLFREHAPLAIEAVTAGMARQDGPAIAAAAHKLKGSAATIAAVDLADLARRIEAAAVASDWTTVHANVPAASAELKLCLRQIDSVVPKA